MADGVNKGLYAPQALIFPPSGLVHEEPNRQKRISFAGKNAPSD